MVSEFLLDLILYLVDKLIEFFLLEGDTLLFEELHDFAACVGAFFRCHEDAYGCACNCAAYHGENDV